MTILLVVGSQLLVFGAGFLVGSHVGWERAQAWRRFEGAIAQKRRVDDAK